MTRRKIVSREEWLSARRELLDAEKAFTRARDELSAKRRGIPRVKVDKEYIFDTRSGDKSLADLFGDNSQLLVYHFMFGPDWEEGCKSCSFWTDNYNGTAIHLAHRNVTMVTIGRAPLEKLEAYRKRMGWDIEMVSSFNNDFNYDYHVSFSPGQMESGEIEYNFRKAPAFSAEAPGISVFYKDDTGDIFHTYSTYSRGLDFLNGTYNLLDLVPEGRNEEGMGASMEWLRRHDQYDAD